MVPVKSLPPRVSIHLSNFASAVFPPLHRRPATTASLYSIPTLYKSLPLSRSRKCYVFIYYTYFVLEARMPPARPSGCRPQICVCFCVCMCACLYVRIGMFAYRYIAFERAQIYMHTRTESHEHKTRNALIESRADNTRARVRHSSCVVLQNTHIHPFG